MKKVHNLKRVYSDKSLAEVGEQVLKALMMRGLKSAQAHNQKHLVSGFIGNSIWVVTRVYKNNTTQKSYLDDELPQDDRRVVNNATFRQMSMGAIVLRPDGGVEDATPE